MTHPATSRQTIAAPVPIASSRPAVRLPLQTGSTGQSLLVYGAVLLVVGAAILERDGVSSVLAVLIGLMGAMGEQPSSWLWWSLGIFALEWGVVLPLLAWWFRARDVVIGPGGVTVESALGSGRLHEWEELRREPLSLRGRAGASSGWFGLRRVVLELGSRKLVTAYEPDEHESLTALRDAIDGQLTGARSLAVDTDSAQVEVLRCRACRAPVAPADLESVTCAHCGAAVVVSGAIREKVRAAAQLDEGQRRNEERLAALQRQPGAARFNLLFLIQLGAVLLVLPYAWFNLADAATIGLAVLLLAVFAFARVLAGRRFALRLLDLRFAALRPAEPDGSPRCRHCGAPLPAIEKGRLVARCVYCEAENVLHIALESAPHPETPKSLDALWVERAAFQRQHLRRLAAAAVICALVPVIASVV